MRQEDIVHNGQQAERIRTEVSEVFKDLRQTLYDNLETCAWYNRKEMSEISRQLKTIRYVEKWLDKRISDGKAAKAKLDLKLRKVI